jgi:hypothetical protein
MNDAQVSKNKKFNVLLSDKWFETKEQKKLEDLKNCFIKQQEHHRKIQEKIEDDEEDALFNCNKLFYILRRTTFNIAISTTIHGRDAIIVFSAVNELIKILTR